MGINRPACGVFGSHLPDDFGNSGQEDGGSYRVHASASMNQSAVSEEESKRRELVGFDWTGKEYRDQKVAINHETVLGPNTTGGSKCCSPRYGALSRVFRCSGSSEIAIFACPDTQVGATWAEKSSQIGPECLHRGDGGSKNTIRASINTQRGAINTGRRSKVTSKF